MKKKMFSAMVLCVFMTILPETSAMARELEQNVVVELQTE